MTLLRAALAALLLACAGRAPAFDPATAEASAADRADFAALVDDAVAHGESTRPFATLVQRLAADPRLQGRRYAAAPLDGGRGDEALRAGFSAFDCVTYVETVLALATTLARGERGFDDYARQLAQWRYRDGEPGYCARLHYFGDWALRHAEAGRLADVTAEVAGGEGRLAYAAQAGGYDFLSRHAGSNPALAGNAGREACVREQEQGLALRLRRADTGLPGLAYLPKARLAEAATRLAGGDLVAWVAEAPGLDVVHVGLVLREGRARPALAQASLRDGRVTIAPDLVAYARSLRRQRGVIVLRPLAPAAPRD